MVDGYPEQIQNQEDSITELTAIAADLQEQREAIENVVLAPNVPLSDAYVEAKRIELLGDFTTFGVTYGVSDISDWSIWQNGIPIPNPTPPPLTLPGVPILLFTGAMLDGTGSAADIAQWNRQNDYAAAYNHIHQDLGTDGTYGIAPTRDSVNTGKSIVTKNKDKIEQVDEIYTRYLP